MKDYEHMIAMFSEAQWTYYKILIDNSPVVIQKIYNKLKAKVEGFGEGNTFYDFLNYWETSGEKIGISYFSAEITNFLSSDPGFVDFVTTYQTNTFLPLKDAVINCYIAALTNKNRKGYDRLFTLYHCYNNYQQKHVNGKSLNEIIDTANMTGSVLDANLIYYDTPFYEKASYKEVQLNYYLFKLQETLKLQIERICAEIIYHKLFAGEDFKYTDIMREAQKYITTEYSRMQYFRVAKKIHKRIFEYLLSNEDILSILDNGMSVVNGKLYTVKEALQFALDHFDELKALKKEEEKEEKPVFVREDDETIREEIVDYCKTHNVPYSFDVGTYSKALIKLKLSNSTIQHKYTTYVYSTGGYRDFKQDKKGYYKSLFVSDIKQLKRKYTINTKDKEDKMMDRLLQVMNIYHH